MKLIPNKDSRVYTRYLLKLIKENKIMVLNSPIIKYKDRYMINIIDTDKIGYTPDAGDKSSCYPCEFFWSTECRSQIPTCQCGHWSAISLFMYSYIKIHLK